MPPQCVLLCRQKSGPPKRETPAEKGEIVSTRGRNAEEIQRFNARAGSKPMKAKTRFLNST
jgi:hypothetical protein